LAAERDAKNKNVEAANAELPRSARRAVRQPAGQHRPRLLRARMPLRKAARAAAVGRKRA
jgi:hypothetical protein